MELFVPSHSRFCGSTLFFRAMMGVHSKFVKVLVFGSSSGFMPERVCSSSSSSIACVEAIRTTCPSTNHFIFCHFVRDPYNNHALSLASGACCVLVSQRLPRPFQPGTFILHARLLFSPHVYRCLHSALAAIPADRIHGGNRRSSTKANST